MISLIICVGMPRSGTSTLYKFFSSINQFNTSLSKEIDYFNLNFKHDLMSFYRHSNVEKKFVDISVNYYLDLDIVIERSAGYNPKFLLCLRKPSDFLRSIYIFSLKRGYSFSTFSDFLDADIGEIMGPAPMSRSPYRAMSVKQSINYKAIINKFIKHEADFFIIPLESINNKNFQNDFAAYVSYFSGFYFEEVNKSSISRFSFLKLFIPKVTAFLRGSKLSFVVGILKRSSLANSIFYKNDGEIFNGFIDLECRCFSGKTLNELDGDYFSLLRDLGCFYE